MPSMPAESGGKIKQECLPVLKEAGVDVEKETFVIFCNMTNWNQEDRIITQNSPYYAAGNNWSGTAWQVDSPILRLEDLPKIEPRVKDGEYGDISIGRYNSIFIGGIAHELGHSLGLPHNCERHDEREAFGTALMGSGNRSYGEEVRGEGRGTFLTLANALRLASHPLFTGSGKGLEMKANAIPQNIAFVSNGKSFRVTGKVKSEPPVYVLTGYMDPDGGSDYDATTCTAIPDTSGNFILDGIALTPGKAGKFRIVVHQANGAATYFAVPGAQLSFPYYVAGMGRSMFPQPMRLPCSTRSWKQSNPVPLSS